MNLKIGIGKYDITGPCWGVGFMGMSNMFQDGIGIHTRLFSRAFVIEDMDNGKSVVIVVADLGMCFQSVHQAVIKKLKNYPLFNPGGKPIYTDENVLISATHTHSGPGGYSHYYMYNLSIIELNFISGFNSQNFECIVEGIFQSIVLAHQNKTEGRILIAEGDVEDCGWIRSMDAYKNNPKADIYVPPEYKKMTLLKFVNNDNEPVGFLNWFAVHPTNMGEKNKLISGDNKGYAEELLEREYKGIICAFANSCCGDISSNMKYGRPDGKHDLEHTEEFGRIQFEKAKELFENAYEELRGNLDYIQTYVDMNRIDIERKDERTWSAAVGLGMSQGSSEDSKGPGKWPEGTTKSKYKKDPEKDNCLIRFLASIVEIKWPTSIDPAYKDGHGEKPILFHSGLSTYKNDPLVPSILPLQQIKLGSLIIISHPGEMTTMAGRILRKEILNILDEETTDVKYAVVATYSGAYSSYATTRQEYDTQHYEGASTLFGPATLEAYLQENKKLATQLKDNKPVENKLEPLDLSSKYKKRKPVIRPEEKPPGHDFGELEGPLPKSSYKKGTKVKVSFWGGHPNNLLKTESTYLAVQKNTPEGWIPMYEDKDSCTIFRCHRRGLNFVVDLEWNIPTDQESGVYRLCYYGYWKYDSRRLVEIKAKSKEFTVC